MNATRQHPVRISAPPHELPAIETFGRYEVLGRIAYGGMAEIFLARERSSLGPSRYVVLKRVLPHVARDERFVEMFLDEARLAMQLSHPSICHIYEFGELEGNWYIAMEWVHGATLGKTIKRSLRQRDEMPTPIAVKVVAHVASALSYAHRALGADGQPLGIVHRDVSPHNVMISFDGHVKLLDFGIARATTQMTKTQEGVIKGKFSYMSPEQCRAEPVDHRSDIFSLGVCLYEALARKRLYQRQNEFHAMQAITGDPVPSVRDLRPDVPEALDAIVQRALQKDPAARYQSAAEMHGALERWLADDGHLVSSDRIAEMMEMLWAEEILSGPTVESSPVAKAPVAEQVPAALAPDAAEPTNSEARPRPTGGSAPQAAATPASVPPASPVPTSTPPSPRRGRPWLVVAALAALVLAAGGGAIAALAIGGRGETPAAETRPSAASSTAASATGAGDEGGDTETSTEGAGGEPPTEGVAGAGEAGGTAAIPAEQGDTSAWGDAVPPGDSTGEQAEQAAPSPPAGARHPRHGRLSEPAAPPGRLYVNSRPWSKVYLGSRLLGTTPIGRVELPPGAHELRLVDRDGETHERTVRIESGEDTRQFFDLTE